MHLKCSSTKGALSTKKYTLYKNERGEGIENFKSWGIFPDLHLEVLPWNWDIDIVFSILVSVYKGVIY